MRGMSEDLDQNNEKAHDGSQDQEQNCETTHVKTGESKGANEKLNDLSGGITKGANEKQMIKSR